MKYTDVPVGKRITCIYGIYDRKNNICLYIGQTVNARKRWRDHMNALKTHSHIEEFNEWFDEHGERDVDFRILEELEECNSHVLNKLERKWFDIEHPLFYREIPVDNTDHTHLTEASKDSISESLLSWYADNGYIDVSGIDVIGLSAGTRFTSRKVDVRTCAVCGEKFHIISSLDWKECHEHHERNPHNRLKPRVIAIPDEYSGKELDELTDDDVKLIYQDMLFSTEDMSTFFNCSKHAVRERIASSGIKLRSYKESIEARKTHTYDDIDVNACKQMWMEGMSLRKIADALGLYRDHVRRFIALHPEFFPERNTVQMSVSHMLKIKESDYNNIKQMRDDGKSWTVIANEFNVCRTTIFKIARKMRDKGYIV